MGNGSQSVSQVGLSEWSLGLSSIFCNYSVCSSKTVFPWRYKTKWIPLGWQVIILKSLEITPMLICTTPLFHPIGKRNSDRNPTFHSKIIFSLHHSLALEFLSSHTLTSKIFWTPFTSLITMLVRTWILFYQNLSWYNFVVWIIDWN